MAKAHPYQRQVRLSRASRCGAR
ncbi:MAG: hypothetical protein EXQ91_02390 [Alphaproteobacteria bacterium]|nr:hypothetical protein [Alphaproteobacteria bacterium]